MDERRLNVSESNSQASSQWKRITPKFVPPLKRATAAGSCNPVDATHNVNSSSGMLEATHLETSGKRVRITELPNEADHTGEEEVSGSPEAHSPPRRYFRTPHSKQRYAYSLASRRKPVGRDRSATLRGTATFGGSRTHSTTTNASMTEHSVASHTLHVFDFPPSQSCASKKMTEKESHGSDNDVGGGGNETVTSRLNSSVSGKTLEQQVHN